MIEDKELGLKIAENPVEAKWVEIKDRMEKSIVNSKIEIEISKKLIQLANRKIKKK